MKWRSEPYLESVGTLLAGIEQYLEQLDEEELARLYENSKGATTTNCWCWTYAAARYLNPVIEGELMRRQTRERQSERTA